MDSFKYSVLYTAIVILIIALIVIGLSIRSSISNAKWPPVITSCPDFWRFDDQTRECVNINNLGNASDTACPNYPTSRHTKCDKFKFEDDTKFSGSYGNCEKQKWADALGIKWDGITNNRELCDD